MATNIVVAREDLDKSTSTKIVETSLPFPRTYTWDCSNPRVIQNSCLQKAATCRGSSMGYFIQISNDSGRPIFQAAKNYPDVSFASSVAQFDDASGGHASRFP